MEKLEIVNMEKEKVCSLLSSVAIFFVNHDPQPFEPSGRQSCWRNGKKMWPKTYRNQRRITAILDARSGGTRCSGMHQKVLSLIILFLHMMHSLTLDLLPYLNITVTRINSSQISYNFLCNPWHYQHFSYGWGVILLCAKTSQPVY